MPPPNGAVSAVVSSFRSRRRVEAFDDVVDRCDEAIHQIGELGPFLWVEFAEDVHHRARPAGGDGVVAAAPFVGDAHQDDPAVLRRREPLDEPVVLQPLDRSGCRRRLDSEPGGELLHRAIVAPGEQVEGVHLALLERLLGAEQVRAQRRRSRAATEFDPCSTDATGVLAIGAVAEVDRAGSLGWAGSGGWAGHVRLYANHPWPTAAERTHHVRRPSGLPLADPSDPTALEALRPLASTEVAVTASLWHREVYTSRGLLTVFRHRPPEGVDSRPAAIVACGGAMGGVLGPGHGLYQRLGERWAERGVEFVRVGYREPNNLDLCAHDLACGVELARDAGAERIVVMGHSFGGAVAIRTAVIMPVSVVGVVTFATQSAGCEVAGRAGRSAVAAVPRRTRRTAPTRGQPRRRRDRRARRRGDPARRRPSARQERRHHHRTPRHLAPRGPPTPVAMSETAVSGRFAHRCDCRDMRRCISMAPTSVSSK